ncbi:MAG: chemotaxis protein CheA [Clostridiales bacterium]|nr:chemotaxis protein CheA [Clostridiales bacterium]
MSFEKDDIMLEIYIHETETLIDQLEAEIIKTETNQEIHSSIDEIFRVMHTIKGNSMMMDFEYIGSLAHEIEDLFDFLRNKDFRLDDYSQIIDLILASIDYFKVEIDKIQNNDSNLLPAEDLKKRIRNYLNSLKGVVDNRKVVSEKSEKELMDIVADKLYYVQSTFTDECQMEGVRAFAIAFELEQVVENLIYYPMNLEDPNARDLIRKDGFRMLINGIQEKEFFEEYLSKNFYLKEFNVQPITLDEFQKIYLNDGIMIKNEKKSKKNTESKEKMPAVNKQKFISVKVDYLDTLLNLVGEIVISESMVSRNKDLEGLQLDNFSKSVHQMRKIVKDLQDVVMEIRMVPLTMTFQKMNRIVRDVASKTDKKVDFELLGEDTQVDKNIIENISDPLMHLIRNAVDHGIESTEERLDNGKSAEGKVVLSAKKSGGDIYISVEDDGKGLDEKKIYLKAFEKGLLTEPYEEYTKKDILDQIFTAGFSTKEQVTGFSGRGVGMDVVKTDIAKIGGSITIQTEVGKGSIFKIKIPMTLAIIDGMIVRIADQKFILPINAIQETFKPEKKNITKDGLEELMILRGEAINIIDLPKLYGIKADSEEKEDGIIVVIEAEGNKTCVFVDEIIGEHQVVVKNFNSYIQKVKGLTGTALLGNGEISLILDPLDLLNE